jgi:hypothetical protein
MISMSKEGTAPIGTDVFWLTMNFLAVAQLQYK